MFKNSSGASRNLIGEKNTIEAKKNIDWKNGKEEPTFL